MFAGKSAVGPPQSWCYNVNPNGAFIKQIEISW